MASDSVSLFCTGCGSRKLSKPLVIPNQPVIMNYRFASAREAASVARRPIELVACNACGLVFNRAFEPQLVPYDERYENTQDNSAVFVEHTGSVARWIARRTLHNQPRILEVGCGKGLFLRTLSDITGGLAVGYDTSYEGPVGRQGSVTFHRKYATQKEIEGSFEVVVCRHVVEHVADIGRFLDDLHNICMGAGDPRLFVETPRLEWIVENSSVWDIFYEHSNYFTEAALSGLCRRAGFVVSARRRVFGGQYQLLELRLARKRSMIVPVTDVGPIWKALNHMEKRILPRLRFAIDAARGGRPWAVWGAGAKGVCLSNRLGGVPPVHLLDVNPAKQGSFVSGTRIPVMAPSHRNVEKLGLVVVANPRYQAEIENHLGRLGYGGNVLNLGHDLL